MMKIILMIFLGLLITIPTAFGMSLDALSDKTGLRFSFPINVDDNYFVIEGTGNFDVKRLDYDVNNNELDLKIVSSLEENLMEITIPKKIFVGDDLIFTIQSIPISVTQASQSSLTMLEVIPKIFHNGVDTIFVTLEFSGIGTHYMTISDSSNQTLEQADNLDDEKIQDITESNGGGCLIATAAFDSEMAPQIQLLRELRDNTVLQTQSGTAFMTGFNQFYYSFSPAVADYERENLMFKEAVKLTLIPLLTSLAILNYVDIDTEQEMLGYGIGVIMLNIGIYFVAPAVLVMSVKKRLFLRK